MSLPWLITTIVAIVGLGIAVATFIGKGPTLKRIHYSSVNFRFVFPAFYDDPTGVDPEPKMTVRSSGEDLILPQVVLLRLENTGKAPIQPLDYIGGLNIELGKRAIFRVGTVKSNRKDVLDVSRTEISRRSHGHIELSPMLLNPRDSLTFILLVDGEVDASLAARISGVETFVKLPQAISGGTNLSMTATSAIYERRVDWPSVRYVDCMIYILPMLLDPSGYLASEVDVRTAGILLHHPYVSQIHLARLRGTSLEELQAFARRDLKFEFKGSTIKRVVVNVGDVTLPEVRANSLVHSSGGVISIDSSIVDLMGDVVTIKLYSDGEPDRVAVVECPEWIENPIQCKVEHQLTVDEHLSTTEPRLLLANQRIYVAWYDIQRVGKKLIMRLGNAREKVRRLLIKFSK